MSNFGSINKEDSIEELEKLVALAEEISANIKNLDKHIIWIYVSYLTSIFVTVFFVAYFLVGFDMYSKIIDIAIIPILAYTLILYVFLIRKKKEIREELRLSEKLLNLIDPVRRELKKETGVVSNAYIEMRLSRVAFSNKRDFFSFSKMLKTVFGHR